MNVTLQGILTAREVVYRHLRPTPLISYPLLDEYLSCRTYIKHENHNPTGSFKIRGGINLIAHLSREEKRRGVITASRGNHGQSIALASKIYGLAATIVVPHDNNSEKNEAMKAYGAELIIHGQDFDESREEVDRIQQDQQLHNIDPANEPMLIHGVGTYALELLQDLPEPDYIFVPLGAGTGLSGILTVVRSSAPAIKVIGVQAEKACSVYLSWKQGEIVTTDHCETMADGLATRVPFELPFSIIQEGVDEIVTVSEEELRAAIYQIYRTTHNVAEGAGASVLAAAKKFGQEINGKQVVLILTGGNIEARTFSEILTQHSI